MTHDRIFSSFEINSTQKILQSSLTNEIGMGLENIATRVEVVIVCKIF